MKDNERPMRLNAATWSWLFQISMRGGKKSNPPSSQIPMREVLAGKTGNTETSEDGHVTISGGGTDEDSTVPDDYSSIGNDER